LATKRGSTHPCLTDLAEPAFQDYEGDDAGALSLVISLNVQRRDLTAGQRAIVAARVWDQHGDSWGGKRRGESNGKSCHLKREDVARAFKVNHVAVRQAKALLKEAPDLAEQVSSRLLSIGNAYIVHQPRKGGVDRRMLGLQTIFTRAVAVSETRKAGIPATHLRP
jgi:hypothetical protein